MKNLQLILFLLIIIPIGIIAQTHNTLKLPLKNTALQNNTAGTIMPYNRLINSAGTVLTYGNSENEDHALDLCVLPDKKFIAIENRYGITILNAITNKIVTSWSYEGNPDYKNFMSTFSGITSFIVNEIIYLSWGSGNSRNGKSAIMIATWNGQQLSAISSINITIKEPATIALPNQIISTIENGETYLYSVLNGNNELIKIRFSDKKIIWTTATGVAPYGLAIIKNRAYVTNWAGSLVTDFSKENAGTPWGNAYTEPATGATKAGSLSVFNITDGSLVNELTLGLHPNAIIKSPDEHFLYIANGNSDMISVVDIKKQLVTDSINIGLFSKDSPYYGSSPNGLAINGAGTILYVANGMDNALAVVKLGKNITSNGIGNTHIGGYIPTEAYPSGIQIVRNKLYVTNLEAKGARIITAAKDLKKQNGNFVKGYSIHKQLASISIIAIPNKTTLITYTNRAKASALFYRISITNSLPRQNILPKPVPERIGEPSIFKHVIYIIKENKTYDQVYGDLKNGRGAPELCIYGDSVTPNQHQLTKDFSLLDNYYASGKSSAEGHQWTDAAMVSDYIEKNVRAWFRSYPHRQTDALVYNKNGLIWNNALDHGKKVRVFGEACTTHYDTKLNWLSIYNKYISKEDIERNNTSTIARLRPIISPTYPDCDNINFTDQLRADDFIAEWNKYEQQAGDSLPNLLVLSLPNDHTAGTAPGFPVPAAMVADNDLALGRIMETVTHSRFWDSTVVFVTEDDSQSGWDHISSYRTTCLVMSAYSLKQKTIHTNYNQTSMVRTIEQILGLPPMNVIDATALPMFDCFNNKKITYRFKYKVNKIPLNLMNQPLSLLTGKAKYFAHLSQNKVFKEIDGGDDEEMNKILWFTAKGNTMYPVNKKMK